ncbi:Flp pilus assembly protein CpaB [Croceicoccus sp. F390]|uniref:Flp pilus assembly protein CpaB n=1 Tax=Croceicoccus esteveae TaxID=3075597 RepID=A0ABU2ZHM7_9SPHN|nr:Flp pilus assembly protein CpaB [Croceicoccus sp. F390]MDT0575691.1 Flp pilus assembly protein CpaB [Croceicoccus sp. F390]
MDRKKLVLLLAALVVAVLAALLARSLFTASAAPPPAATIAGEPVGERVLVAQRALPTGTIITADAVRFTSWPREMVKDAYYLEAGSDMKNLIGTVVRFPITAGQPVTRGALVMPGDRGFLAAALGPGMRAVTVPVSDTTGVAGFVFPGDRVDLVLTQEVAGVEGQPLRAAETLLRNLRVLATDQTTRSSAEGGQTQVSEFSTVTLEVTPRIAEIVAVAQAIGTISLSLRALADTQDDLEQAIASAGTAIPADATPQEQATILQSVMSRPQSVRSSVQTGGDISRFQRRTMPPQTLPRSSVTAAPPPSYANSPAMPSPAPAGPGIRVSRGNETQLVPVGR